MKDIRFLLGILMLAICFHQCLTASTSTTVAAAYGLNSTAKAQCPEITLEKAVMPTENVYPEENTAVSTIKSRSVFRFKFIIQIINNKQVKSLQINKTTFVNIEKKTITPSSIYIKRTQAISPTSILVYVGSTEAQSSSNQTSSVIPTPATTNTGSSTSDSCDLPVQSTLSTDTSTVTANTCSKITSAVTSNTITTTEEVIPLGPDKSSTTCTYY